MQISRWQDPPHNLTLQTKQLHLWRIALTVPSATHQRLYSWLSPEEVSRANRLLDRKKATDFIVARGRLRQILANYLGSQPAVLTFNYGSAGKPHLETPSESNITFNLSHSGDWALLAVTAGAEVGVDLERIDPDIDVQAVAGKFFSSHEKAIFAKLINQRRLRGFYRVWTLKEAQMKRTGFGFSEPSEQEILPSSEEANRLFPIGKNYLGAISTSAEISSILRYQLINP